MPTRCELTVDPTGPLRDDQLLAVAAALVPGWKTADNVVINPILGGITNLLFKLQAPGLATILVRLYGPRTEVVIDRAAENQLLARLSDLGFGPRLYGHFDGGRVEGFFDGFRSLEPDELGRAGLRRHIGAAIADLHAIPPTQPDSQLWSTLTHWMNTARSLHFEGQDAQRYAALELDRHAELLDRAAHTWPTLTDAQPGTLAARRLVLSHNDLLAGNILVDGDEQQVRLIDYEYGGCAPAAFNLANHFCEYAGFDSDFERGFPSADVQADVIDAYLAATWGRRPTPQDVAAFHAVVTWLVIPDHLWWGCWAVIQARYSPIAFDFMGYAALRLAGCDLHRKQLGVLWP